MKKSRNRRRFITLGIFLVITMGILVTLSLVLTNTGFDRATWTAHFGEAFRVKAGSEVFTSGIKVGVVHRVELVPVAEMGPDHQVKVILKIRRDVVLWEGAAVFLTSRGLLGRATLELRRGTPGTRALDAETDTLPGRIAPSLFDGLNQLVEDNSANLTRITENLVKVSDRLERGEGNAGRLFGPDDAIAKKIERLLDNFVDVSEAAAAPDGTLMKLLRDPELHDRFLKGVTAFQEVGERIRSGKGPLGRLVYDEKTAASIAETIDLFRDRMRALDRGEGSLGKLLTDDRLHDTLLEGVAALRDFAVKIQTGEGTFSKLLDDNGVIYENIRLFTEDLASVSADMRAGKGTLGKLLVDDGIYNELFVMLQTFRETGDVARENAPLTSLISFSSLFFNVLN